MTLDAVRGERRAARSPLSRAGRSARASAGGGRWCWRSCRGSSCRGGRGVGVLVVRPPARSPRPNWKPSLTRSVIRSVRSAVRSAASASSRRPASTAASMRSWAAATIASITACGSTPLASAISASVWPSRERVDELLDLDADRLGGLVEPGPRPKRPPNGPPWWPKPGPRSGRAASRACSTASTWACVSVPSSTSPLSASSTQPPSSSSWASAATGRRAACRRRSRLRSRPAGLGAAWVGHQSSSHVDRSCREREAPHVRVRPTAGETVLCERVRAWVDGRAGSARRARGLRPRPARSVLRHAVGGRPRRQGRQEDLRVLRHGRAAQHRGQAAGVRRARPGRPRCRADVLRPGPPRLGRRARSGSRRHRPTCCRTGSRRATAPSPPSG